MSFNATTGDPNRVNIDPDELGTLEITSAQGTTLDRLFDFFARYVRRVQSDDYIRRKLKASVRSSFLDVIGPNDIAYVIAAFKNNKDMWDQDIRMRELGSGAMGNPEEKLQPRFTSGKGKKREQGKSLWNKEGMTYFKKTEQTWKNIYDSENDMKVLYNGWEDWIATKGKEIKVGESSKKTFHYVMGTWYDGKSEMEEEKIDESDDDDNFGDEGGYSSDRPRSRHSGNWRRGLLMDTATTGSKRGDEYDEDEESDGSEESDKAERNKGPKTPDKSEPPLFSVPAAGTNESPAGNTRMASKRAAAAATEKEQRKRRKK